MPVSLRTASPSAGEHRPKGLKFSQPGLPVIPAADAVDVCVAVRAYIKKTNIYVHTERSSTYFTILILY